MSDKLVTLTTYTYTTESYILAAKLEEAGIKPFIKNENLVQTQNFLSNAVGGIDVQVREEDLENALPILKELEKQTKLAEQVPAELEKDYKKVLVYCPDCESSTVYQKKGSFFSLGEKEHVCADCGYRWKR